MLSSWYEQTHFRVRLERGRDGARRAAARGDAVVIVDTLSFSTAAAAACSVGAVVYPLEEKGAAAEELAARLGAEVAVRREDVPGKGRFSLSPQTLLEAEGGTKIVLPSPNGAACSRLCASCPAVWAVALVNAGSVGRAVSAFLRRDDSHCVTLLACGERWETPGEDGALRVALEDDIGAGAVAACLPPRFSRSPEVRAATAAFRQVVRSGLTQTVAQCGSGQELYARGWGSDALFAARLDALDVVPRLVDGERYENGLSPTPRPPPSSE